MNDDIYLFTTKKRALFIFILKFFKIFEKI